MSSELVGSRLIHWSFFNDFFGQFLATWWIFQRKNRDENLELQGRGDAAAVGSGQRDTRFMNTALIGNRNMDRSDISDIYKRNTFFEYMVSIRWSPPFPTLNDTRPLLPLETQSPPVCCQNPKLREAVNIPKPTLCAANEPGPIAFILGIQWLATQSSFVNILYGSEIRRSPVEVDSLSTIIYKGLDIQTVAVWDF